MIAWMILACGEPEAPVPSLGRAEALAIDAWPAALVREPSQFAALVADDRDGWAALHAHRYVTAYSAGGPAVARRAAEAEAQWRSDEARLIGATADRLFTTWIARPGAGPSAWLSAAASLAAVCTGIGDGAVWRSRVIDPKLAAALTEPRVWTGDDALGRRMAIHREAATGGLEPLFAIAGQPIWTESLPGFERRFLDPCIASTARDFWLARAETHPAPTGIAASIFTGRGEGLPPFPRPGADIPERAREAVHALDETLAGWREGLLAAADADGRELLLDLRLIEVFRQQWLVGRGRELLAANRPQEALATLEAAIDPLADDGPTDPPALWVLVAHARVATGRTREALDALEHLRPDHPDVTAVAELVGDLAVLQGLDRQGDSKEN